MEKKNKTTFVLTVMVCLLPMLLGIVLYNKLPEQMPIHFTTGNVPDNYAPKAFALFGIPLIMAALQSITMISQANKLKSKDKPRIIKIMEWFIPVTTVFIYIIMVEYPLGSSVYVGKSVLLILGILFMIIGNYMPKMSYETGKAVFHPTPKSEKAFRKTSRIMGYSFVGLGILLLIMIIWV